MKEKQHEKYLFVNLDKKIIMEPGKLTLSGESSLQDISLVHPRWGNPFQYEVFQLLMNNWKGDRFVLVEDSEESRDYLTKEEGYTYYRNFRGKFRREKRQEGSNVVVISLDQREVARMQRNWEKFINQFVIINYDDHLFMTIDRRLFKRAKSSMPFFFLAQMKDENDSDGSWAGCRVGIEPLDTATFDEDVYFEMFRMIGDKSACQLGVEDFERRFGLESWKTRRAKN